MKWKVVFNNFKENQSVHIVEANTGDEAIKEACKDAKIEYNPHRQPSCSFQVVG